jgi:hypothetical protein
MASLGNYLMAAEAVIALGAYRLALRLPFRWLVRTDQRDPPHPAAADCLPNDPRARRVRRIIARVQPRLPWHSTCLVQALAARSMLRRRHVATVLHLGVARGEGLLQAHAWLEADGGYVCGGKAAIEFTPIAAFSNGTARL